MSMKLIFSIIFTFLFSTAALSETKTLRIFAAASFTNVLNEIAQTYKGNAKINFNFDATSKIAKQIESGAPADLFFSADKEWMDYAERNNLIESASRTNLVSNELVMIVPRHSKMIPVTIQDVNDNFYHHLALAGESVPAGKAARVALKDEISNKKIVNADNVRIALNWVAANEAPAGVVYATDAKSEPNVKIAFTLKKDTYPQIIYTAAVVRTSLEKTEAQKFLDFCKTNVAKEIFKKAGFIPL